MKRFFNFFLMTLVLFLFATSCDGKRPDSGILEFDLIVRSLQKNASVEVFGGEKLILSGTTDDSGSVTFGSVNNIGELKIRVCGGTVDLVSSNEAVAWNGCSESAILATDEKNIVVIVDFFSSFIEKYRSATSKKEWFDYLGITGDVFPELQSSLTDATKRWIWQQAFSKIAETVSLANNTQPETQFSTENLLTMLRDDLDDDNVINGSTYAKFGSAFVNATFMKGLLSDFLSEVSDRFSAAELKEWSEKIANSSAAFLGGADAEKGEMSIDILVYPEGNKGAEVEYFSGAVVVEAKATPEKMIASLVCYADGEKMADKNEEEAFFQGSFITENIEDEKEVNIRCEASNGVTIESVEKTITVNNGAPSVSAFFYEYGTLNPTGSEESPAKNSIDIKVEASHKRFAVEDLNCSIEGYAMKNQSNVDHQYKAEVDTEKLPDGKNILECEASVNRKKYKVTFPFYTKNTFLVKVKPYVTNPLSSFERVSVLCGDTSDIKSRDTISSSEDKIKVKHGEICIVSVAGGKYKPVVSENEEIEKSFNGTLSAVFVAESDKDVVVTPLTTIASAVFLGRRNGGGISDKELYDLVTEHLYQHLSHSFTWSEEPSNTNAADSKTKYYVLLAGLEYLAYFMETDIGSEHGIYDVSNILQLLREDIKDTVFDGKNGNTPLFFGDDMKKKELDSNFFRYYYALSIKRFLTSPFNKTVFSQLGSIVGKIASNSDQFLFPADSVPVAIDSSGPKIEIESFNDLFEVEDGEDADIIGDLGNYRQGESVPYDPQNGVVPHFAKAFLLKFKVSPQEGTFTDIDSVSLKSDDADFVFRVKRVEPQGVGNGGFSSESREFVMLAEYFDESYIQMEKQLPFSISAQDIAYNTSNAEVTVFLDNKRPLLHLDCPEGVVRSEDVAISWEVSDSIVENIRFTLFKSEEEDIVIFEEGYESCSFGECSLSADRFAEIVFNAGFVDSAVDGLYKVALYAVDHAGNYSIFNDSFNIDTTPPAAPMVRVESDGRVLFKRSVTNKNYFTVSLDDPDEDIDTWAVKVLCVVFGSTTTQERTSEYVAANESVDFFNLLMATEEKNFVACFGAVSVCDEIGNCSNKDFSEFLGAIIIDNHPPHFESYDKTQSVFTECIDDDSPYVSVFHCVNSPNCSNGEFLFVNKAKPQLLLTYTDNLSAPENLRVFIHSAEMGWIKNCPYIPNVNSNWQGDCDKFYCDLEGGIDGSNNFIVRAYDEVGNYSEHPLVIPLDLSAVETLEVNLRDKFFTSKGSSYLWWDTKAGVDYKCTIKKRNDENFSANCSNGGNITPSMLSGSGYYTVSVESKSATTKRTDVAEFKFFDIADLNISLKPEKGQFLYPGDLFKVGLSIDSGKMAEISNVEIYLYGRYLEGHLQDSYTKLVASRNYPISIHSTDTVFSSPLPLETKGQFRNASVKITFADNTSYSKNFSYSSENAVLYCLLSSDERKNDASVTFKDNALKVSFTAPKCLAESDYTMTLNAYYPAICDGREILDSSLTVNKNFKGNFSVKGDFVFFKNEDHCHDVDCNAFGNFCDDFCHSCAVQTHNFSPKTNLKVNYNYGGSFVVSGNQSVQSLSSTSEIIFYNAVLDYYYDNNDCNKCKNKLGKQASCSGEKGKTKILK